MPRHRGAHDQPFRNLDSFRLRRSVAIRAYKQVQQVRSRLLALHKRHQPQMGEDGVGGQFRGVSYEAGVHGLRGDVLRGTDGTVVYVSVCLDSVWPSLTADMEELYQLGQHCVPVMSRKGGRMMCMGENRTPVLLRMLAGGRIQEFRECAAVFYAKMQETYVGDRRVFPMYSSEKTGCLILLGALFHLASRQNDRKSRHFWIARSLWRLGLSRFYEWRPLRHGVLRKAPQFRAMIDVPTIEFCSFKETVTAENSSFKTFSDHNKCLERFSIKCRTETATQVRQFSGKPQG
jgi:hypothetical protein